MKNAIMVLAVLATLSSIAGADVVLLGYAPYWQDIPAEAGAMGMAGAWSAVLRGPEAAHWNPAVPLEGIDATASWSRISEREILMSVNRWTGALSVEGRRVRLSLIHDRTALGPYTTHLPYDPESGQEIRSFDTTNILSVSGDVSPLVTLGLGLRRVEHGFSGTEPERDESSYASLGLDLGVSLGREGESSTASWGWRTSAAWINGVPILADDEMEPVKDLKLGVAWSLGVGESGETERPLRLLMACDWTRSSTEVQGDDEWERRLGVEGLLYGTLALRVGTVDQDHEPFVVSSTWGVGLVLDRLIDGTVIRMDYAHAKIDAFFIYDEDVQHYLGITVGRVF